MGIQVENVDQLRLEQTSSRCYLIMKQTHYVCSTLNRRGVFVTHSAIHFSGSPVVCVNIQKDLGLSLGNKLNFNHHLK